MKKLDTFIYKGFIKGDLVYIKQGYAHEGIVTRILGFYQDPVSRVMLASLAPVISTSTNIVDKWLVPLSEIEIQPYDPDKAKEVYNKLIMINHYRAFISPPQWDGTDRRKSERDNEHS